MCVVVGIVDFERPVDANQVSHMADVIAHRGPDGRGNWCERHVAFESRRLAIVDVAGGVQPTWNEDATVHTVFNGEIYNHRELRRDLAQRGHRFRSGSDAEVIPHLYEEHGTKFVEELDGDFAIAVWDSVRQSLVLARDRVGVKPLFFHYAGPRLTFGSEIKAVLASGNCEIALDRQGLSDCFSYGQPVSPRTCWAGVRDLRPGTVLVFERGRVRETTYYTPLQRSDLSRPLLKGSEAIVAFRDTFIRAVRKRLPDEVRAAACLSGGLDSTAVVGVAARSCETRLPTMSIRLPGESLDEGEFSRHAAAELGLENEELPISGRDACAALPRTLWHLETPQWFGVAPPFYLLAQKARQAGAKVALTGDGADELLGGYDFYRLRYLHRALTRSRLTWLESPLFTRALKWTGVPAGVIDQVLGTHARLEEYRRQFGEAPAWIYLWSGMSRMAALLLGDRALAPSPLPRPTTHDWFRRTLHFEYVTRLPNWVLLLSDRLSMAHGIEVRVPFMDRDLLDLCANLAPEMLLRRGVEKYVLKRAVREQVPRRIRQRRKKPFFTPVTSWYLDGPGRELADTYLSESRVKQFGLFDVRATRAAWTTAVQRGGTWEGMLAEWSCMMVLSTHLLLEQFTAGNLAPYKDALRA